jgi:hypothetical protein
MCGLHEAIHIFSSTGIYFFTSHPRRKISLSDHEYVGRHGRKRFECSFEEGEALSIFNLHPNSFYLTSTYSILLDRNNIDHQRTDGLI